MYGKSSQRCISLVVAPTEALFLQSSVAFDGLHDDINFFILSCLYRKLFKKQRPHSQRERTIVQIGCIFCYEYATLAEVDQKIHQSVNFLPLTIYTNCTELLIECKGIMHYSFITSWVNDSKPKAWHFQRGQIFWTYPRVQYILL